MTPKPYISWSSINTLGDFSPAKVAKWKEIYLYDKKMNFKGMELGKKMATGLEDDEATGDMVLDAVMADIPKFEIMDKVLEDPNGEEIEYFDYKTKEYVTAKVPFIKDGKNRIPILVKMDSSKIDGTAFKEYKTAKEHWTRKQVDESGQITFYAMGLFIKTGKIPNDIELVEIETKTRLDGKMECTGAITRHPTVRTMGQILNMMVRVKKSWSMINKICEEELLQ